MKPVTRLLASEIAIVLLMSAVLTGLLLVVVLHYNQREYDWRMETTADRRRGRPRRACRG